MIMGLNATFETLVLSHTLCWHETHPMAERHFFLRDRHRTKSIDQNCVVTLLILTE